MEIIRADWLDDGETLHADCALAIDGEGMITAVGSFEEVQAHQPKSYVSDMRGHIVLPGCVNAHSHSFQVLLRGRADHPANFADWVSSHLYPTLAKLDDRALEIAALLAFAQMVQAGVTTVGEFHYIHNDSNGPGGNRIDKLVLEAARRVGLRTTFLRCFYDTQSKPGQERFAETPEQAKEACLELHEAYKDDPMVQVMPAPHSLHGASPEMIRAAFEVAETLDTKFHIHLAEQQGDIAFCEAKYKGLSPLKALESLGVLGPRAVIVHGLWLNEDERALMAEAGASLVYNPGTNMALGDGVADIPDLLKRGVPVALGTDANYTLSIFQEMRAMEYLQRVKALEMGILARATGQAGGRLLLDSGRRHGAHVLNQRTGFLKPGWPADLLVLDRHDPSLLPASIHGGDGLLSAFATSLIPESALRMMLIQGRRVISHGQLVTFSNEEIAELIAETQAS